MSQIELRTLYFIYNKIEKWHDVCCIQIQHSIKLKVSDLVQVCWKIELPNSSVLLMSTSMGKVVVGLLWLLPVTFIF